ncbi:Unknown protein sequence [Pseudomonas syringae pv. syringae]|nr:Unknown protein sequence [Pseudomonas syringae pv. syringae]
MGSPCMATSGRMYGVLACNSSAINSVLSGRHRLLTRGQ